MQESGPPERTTEVVDHVRDTVVSTYQLLAMLEVVHEWGRGDGLEMLDAAERLETVGMRFHALANPPPDAPRLAALRQDLNRLAAKVERLLLLAPLQAQTPALLSSSQRALSLVAQTVKALQTQLDLLTARAQ